MEKNSAGSPLDQTIEQYKRDLMAVYRRSRTPVSPADQPPAPKPARPRPADPPAAKSALAEMPPEPSHTPEPAHEEPTGELPEETAPEKAQLPTLGEFLRERIGNPPDNSGTPRDAIGRNEEEYLTAAAAFLRELLAQFAPGSKLSGESTEPGSDSTDTVPEEPERPTLGEFLRERIGNPPDNSGTPGTPSGAMRRNTSPPLLPSSGSCWHGTRKKLLPLTTPIIPQMGRTSNHLPLQKGNMSSSSRKIPIPA